MVRPVKMPHKTRDHGDNVKTKLACFLQALAAGLKAYSTWEAVHTLQTCRECTGGMVSAHMMRRGFMRFQSIAFCLG